MPPFEPRLMSLAMRAGISFDADGVPLTIPLDTPLRPLDLLVITYARWMESLLHSKDIADKQRDMARIVKGIDDLSLNLGNNDLRVQTLREMLEIVNSILEGIG